MVQIYLVLSSLCIYECLIYFQRHVGYHSDSLLPFNRGFQSGLYSHQGLQYFARGISRTIGQMDDSFGAPSPQIQQLRAQYFSNGDRIPIHDTYKIDQYIETPTFQQDGLSSSPSFGEDLYTQDIKEYIKQQSGDNPFFIYYSQWVCIIHSCIHRHTIIT